MVTTELKYYYYYYYYLRIEEENEVSFEMGEKAASHGMRIDFLA